jgi:hypothetical protein
MHGAIPPLPNTPSWRGAQLKHRVNFNLYLREMGGRVLTGFTLLAQDGDQWQAYAKALISLRVP